MSDEARGSRLEATLWSCSRALPGNNYEFTQPIQMRFNELIAGVRSDVAVKVYGDEFPAMQATAGEIARVLRRIPGAADVKVEQTEGLPVLTAAIDRPAIARYGLSVADVQHVVAAAVPLPSGSWLDWGGQFENLIESRARLLVVPLCFVLIFLLLYGTFGELRSPCARPPSSPMRTARTC